MLVNWGPLAVTVDAVSWQDYLGGIIQYHCSSGRANHAVLITGFDRTGAFLSTELQPSRFCSFSLTCNLPPVGQVIKIQNWVFCWELFGLVSHQFWKCSLIPGEKLFLSVLLRFCGTSCPCKIKNTAICVFTLAENISSLFNTGILALSSVWTTVVFTVLYHQTIRNYEILKW